jgi:tetratricopeptide (TPR) repeat protein
MGEPVGAKRQVKPWVAIVAVVATMAVFGGIWLTVGNRRLGRVFGGPHVAQAHRTKAWRRANGLCRRLNMAGNSYAVAGMYDSALTCYREVLRISQEEGLADRMAAAYANMSNVFDYLHMPESVRFYMNTATALSRLSNRPSQVMNSLLEQGTFLFCSMGNSDSAKVLLERALAESRDKGDGLSEAAALNVLAKIQATLEQYDSARVLLESCATKSHILKDAAGEASALHSLGMIYLRRDRLNDAKPWLLKAIEVAHANDIIGEEAPALFELALIRADQDEYELAQVNVEQALKLFERAGDNDGISRCRDCRDALIQAQRWKQRSKALDTLIEKYRRKSIPSAGI